MSEVIQGKVKSFDGRDVTQNCLALMTKFRKIPVVVEAIQLNDYFQVETLEGMMKGNPGDWLIKGVKGDLYPCKPDIFIETYEEEE